MMRRLVLQVLRLPVVIAVFVANRGRPTIMIVVVEVSCFRHNREREVVIAVVMRVQKSVRRDLTNRQKQERHRAQRAGVLPLSNDVKESRHVRTIK